MPKCGFNKVVLQLCEYSKKYIYRDNLVLESLDVGRHLFNSSEVRNFLTSRIRTYNMGPYK